MNYAYKGYLICRNDLNGTWWIEKCGTFICYAINRTQAMRVIDETLS
jgi:hypothetical protein